MRFLRHLLLAVAVLFAPSLIGADTLPLRLDDPQAKAFHHIEQATLVEADSCTGEAIGPHAILTATHCELGSDKVSVDGTEYVISQKLRDGMDHTIYIMPDANFPVYLQFANRAPVAGERVRSWGWPEGRNSIAYAEGTYLGFIQDEEGDKAYKFDLPVFEGDSGAAILDDAGRILSVVSLGNQDGPGTVGFSFDFTSAQLALTR